MRTLLTTAALSLAMACPALAEQFDLRGPAYKAGHTTIVSADTVAERGTMTMNIQGQNMEGKMSTTSKQQIKVEILELDEGQPSKVQTTFLKSSSTTKTVMLGQENVQEDDTMQGVVMTSVKTDDGWRSSARGGTFPPEANDLIKKAGYVDPRLAYPDKPVGVGEKWEIEGESLAAFTGMAAMPGADITGKMSFEFKEIKGTGQNQVAVLEYDADSTIFMSLKQQGTNMDMEIKIDGKGVIERNLTTFTNDVDFKGDMKMKMKVSAGGAQFMKMDAEMPMKIKSEEELE